MEPRGKRPPLWLAAVGFGAFALLVLALFLSPLAGGQALAQDGDAPDTPVEAEPAVENDAEPSDVESNDDAVSEDDSAGDALAKNAPIEQWQWLMSGALPYVIAIAQRYGWSVEKRTGVMFVFAAVSAIVGSYLRGELDNFAYSLTGVMQLAVLVWGSYQVQSRLPIVSGFLRAIEDKTTPAEQRRPGA